MGIGEVAVREPVHFAYLQDRTDATSMPGSPGPVFQKRERIEAQVAFPRVTILEPVSAYKPEARYPLVEK